MCLHFIYKEVIQFLFNIQVLMLKVAVWIFLFKLWCCMVHSVIMSVDMQSNFNTPYQLLWYMSISFWHMSFMFWYRSCIFVDYSCFKEVILWQAVISDSVFGSCLFGFNKKKFGSRSPIEVFKKLAFIQTNDVYNDWEKM